MKYYKAFIVAKQEKEHGVNVEIMQNNNHDIIVY
jgi:hypothetical protein